MTECLPVEGLLEVCVGDYVEVETRGGRRFFGSVEKVGEKAILVRAPEPGSGQSLVVVRVGEGLCYLRLVRCGSIKPERCGSQL